MSRIVLTDGSGRWFESDKAQMWEEATWWDGNNHVSKATGEKFDHQRLYRTKGGVWVLHTWSQWQGRRESYEEIDEDAAVRWFSLNEYEEPGTEAYEI